MIFCTVSFRFVNSFSAYHFVFLKTWAHEPWLPVNCILTGNICQFSLYESSSCSLIARSLINFFKWWIHLPLNTSALLVFFIGYKTFEKDREMVVVHVHRCLCHPDYCHSWTIVQQIVRFSMPNQLNLKCDGWDLSAKPVSWRWVAIF